MQIITQNEFNCISHLFLLLFELPFTLLPTRKGSIRVNRANKSCALCECAKSVGMVVTETENNQH